MTARKLISAATLAALLAIGGVACEQGAQEDGGTDTPAETEGGAGTEAS